MPRFLFCVFAVLLCGSFALGQSPDRFELFAGYSLVNADFTLTSRTVLNGWNASMNFKSGSWFGLVADFSGYYPSDFGHAKAHTFLFGPQVSVSLDKITPFAHFLIGDTNVSYTADSSFPRFSFLSANNSFTYGGGGGLDYRFTPHLAVRGQADWLHNGFNTVDNQLSYRLNHNVARISTGIVFRF
jgi:opacity protein-like surface antigen